MLPPFMPQNDAGGEGVVSQVVMETQCGPGATKNRSELSRLRSSRSGGFSAEKVSTLSLLSGASRHLVHL